MHHVRQTDDAALLSAMLRARPQNENGADALLDR
jgi:hypothetical protein